MRFVDSDALMKSFENVLGAAPCELNGYEIWEVLNAQESVDAIPLDWLREKMRGYASALKSTEMDAVVRVMHMWEEEQEAQK